MEAIFGPKGRLKTALSGFECRPGQLQMAEAVRKALVRRDRLVVEAGTGTGKTLAYLIPALLSGLKVVVSTGTKNLQEQLLLKELPLIRRCLGLRFKAVAMKGRTNYLCLRRWENLPRLTRRPFPIENSHLKTIAHWLHKTRTGDRAELTMLPEDLPLWSLVSSNAEQCLARRCTKQDDCFITRIRQKAASANLVVVNHHLFFADLAVREKGYGEVIPRYEAVIFDEAHQLEDVATQYFGLSVSTWRAEQLLRDAQQTLTLTGKAPRFMYNTIEVCRKRFDRFFSSFRHSSMGTDENYRLKAGSIPGEAERCLPDLFNTLTLLATGMKNLENANDETDRVSQRMEQLREELGFIMGASDCTFVYWCEPRGKGIFLHADPIDISHEMERYLYKKISCLIFTSATLSAAGSFDYFKGRMGLAPDTEDLSISTHFDFSSQALLYIPRNAADPTRQGFVRAVAEEVREILRASRGRAFVLFTSYHNMLLVFEALKGHLEYSVMLQGERPRSALLEDFRKDISSVLFATSSFWEGVDVRGEALSCVIIDKLPFASPTDPLVEARIEKIASEGGNPFFAFQVPNAIISLRQGVGRLIRDAEDQGIVAILDGRILYKRYGRLFLESLPPIPLTRDISDVRRFFSNLPTRSMAQS
ncbi:MAG: ATP-dependent DNA helicase [Deltaproteobacteria bacterium]|nr:ATP-dependent DNA helicase [Deltaproteobacteria bacterium]MBW2307979.1 ATP-dependent DNA helicase [Deltaproteobacteria bacterium]